MRLKRLTEFSTGYWRDFFARQTACVCLLAGIASAVAVGAEVSSAHTEPGGIATSAAELGARAEAGDPWAQLNLGASFDRGLAGLPLDPVRAVAWYRRAAEAGLAEAQFNLAHCLVTGSGTPRDEAQGLRWMLRAAAQGLASAQYLAGVMHAEGVGTAPDVALAITWLERAVANGNSDASRMLQRLQDAD